MVAPAVVLIVPDQSPADATVKGPKIGLLDKYNSTRGAKAEVYVTQIGLMFPNNQSKVIFSISYLTGQASEWAQAIRRAAGDFNQHAANTGWETTTLMSQYHQGLKKTIRLALVLAREFTALTDLCNLALKINNEINGANPCSTDSTHTVDPNAMDLSAMRGTLSTTEKADMMRARLCFF
ncbi:hypothetical protein PTTG_01443 [Puccinia triticina 1-1 BBBD Race 1]|uniref:DUF4939 domain-containing protein n=1 Tax=Puccinia triticina (isolate 1-1 / race 1 (BBBD)) TaxID=630390 RepID=A0A180H691_PUCT1|nr:hypothetical protein PTTG_01443 [Puccinia triticina 1-1 BBBD Race 1]